MQVVLLNWFLPHELIRSGCVLRWCKHETEPDCRVNHSLVIAVMQLTNVFHSMSVDVFLQYRPHCVVHWTHVWTVWWPECGQNKIWCSNSKFCWWRHSLSQSWWVYQWFTVSQADLPAHCLCWKITSCDAVITIYRLSIFEQIMCGIIISTKFKFLAQK